MLCFGVHFSTENSSRKPPPSFLIDVSACFYPRGYKKMLYKDVQYGIQGTGNSVIQIVLFSANMRGGVYGWISYIIPLITHKTRMRVNIITVINYHPRLRNIQVHFREFILFNAASAMYVYLV